MDSKDIRQKYTEFFLARQHALIPSASLIPEGDSSLLFVNSGMFPLVPYLLGQSHPAGVRLVNSQKSFRTEDIDEVGDNRHNTFFEMLGNWSLGNYWKSEQLNWWFEFLVDELRLDPQRLYQTVYAGSADGTISKDTESIEIVRQIFNKYGVDDEDRIFEYTDKNWWQLWY
jgi:alanyl-tRNA synthetase